MLLKFDFIRSENGFTFVEIMVSVLIFAIMVGVVLTTLNIANKNMNTDLGAFDLQLALRSASDSLVKELRGAQNSSIDIDVIDSNDDTISFNTPSKSGIILYRDRFDANGDGVTTQIILEYPTGTRRVLANNISKLKFVLSSMILQVQLETAKTIQAREITSFFSVDVRLRNV